MESTPGRHGQPCTHERKIQAAIDYAARIYVRSVTTEGKTLSPKECMDLAMRFIFETGELANQMMDMIDKCDLGNSSKAVRECN